ncbi:MAG: transcriptional repressor [Deltaproteobacteria bacterium]|jgi:Fur family zinc uptake transcriptional regulator|nr:transcriptional repressor [Deltaproteobacteria bacterium]
MVDINLFPEALASLNERVARYLAIKGEKLTRLRYHILSILVLANKPLKGYAIVELARERGWSLSPASVYRTLNFFIECGLVHKVNSLNAFVACLENLDGQGHNAVLLVCPDCHKTLEINDRLLTAELFKRLSALGFSIDFGAVEVSGMCQECAAK